MSSTRSQRGRVIVVSGPSGVGKGTLVRKLLENSDFPLELSVSATTRSPRAGESHGVAYWFLSREEFLQRRERGEFLESFEVYPGGALYGTLKQTVDDAVKQGKWVLLEIDVKGAKSIVEQIPEAITIFIEPPSIEELRKRLEGRATESPEELAKRLAQAQEEIQQAGFYRYRVLNDNLDDAYAKLVDILQNHQDA
ncbi:MAG: guanylate kinase [Planctomycetia bacterium]|nr:guanylate kinase [Planctomycetia bacterium]